MEPLLAPRSPGATPGPGRGLAGAGDKALAGVDAAAQPLGTHWGMGCAKFKEPEGGQGILQGERRWAQGECGPGQTTQTQLLGAWLVTSLERGGKARWTVRQGWA